MIKNLDELYKTFLDSIVDTIELYLKSSKKQTLQEMVDDNVILFADEHRMPGLIPALKFEAHKIVATALKEVKKDLNK